MIRHVAILGRGTGGTLAANRLRRATPLVMAIDIPSIPELSTKAAGGQIIVP